MSSLIEEIQRDALNQEIRVTALLQKSLVVATKLKLDEFISWIQLELDGYSDNKVPEYRILHGAPKVFNPYRGYIPLQFDNLEEIKLFSKRRFNTSLGEVEHEFLDMCNAKSHSCHLSYPSAVEKMLMDRMGDLPMQPSLCISSSQFKKILDAVRKIILEWTLKLEADGIVGDGMSFSKKETERAQAITYHIENYIQGNVQDSQFQIKSKNSPQSKTAGCDIASVLTLIQALRDAIDIVGVDNQGKQKMKSEISSLEEQIKLPAPQKTVLLESISSIKRILEGAGGNLIASGLISQIRLLFG